MKKMTLIIACLGLLSLASCKKDRTCNCTETNTYTDFNGVTHTNVTTINATLTKISKGDAKNACANSAETDTNNGTTTITKTDCKLS